MTRLYSKLILSGREIAREDDRAKSYGKARILRLFTQLSFGIIAYLSWKNLHNM
jgi:hypothetical protein